MLLSGIQHWLAHVPTAQPAPKPVPTTRKRPLAEMSGNIVTPEPSPSKSKRIRVTHRREVYPEEEITETNNDATPRAPQFWPRPPQYDSDAFANLPSLPPQSDVSSLHSGSGHTASSATTSSRASRKRKGGSEREKSPVRNLSVLQLCDYTTYFELLHTLQELSEGCGIRRLACDLDRLRKGRGLIPMGDQAALDYICPASLEEEDEEEASARQLLFGRHRSTIGQVPVPSDVADLLQVQREAMRMNKHESAWNTDFHSPMFKLALKGSPFKDEIFIETITTASILPMHQPSFGQDQVLPPKKVDYACCFRLSPTDIAALQKRSILEVNHTAYEPLRSRPIAFSIETKTSTSSTEEAKLQVTIWALAQRSKLRNLLHLANNPDAPLPSLPLIVVQAYCWEVYFLDCRPEGAVLRGPVLLGNSNTPEGFYSIVAGLQTLIVWAREEYMPWWRVNILERLVG